MRSVLAGLCIVGLSGCATVSMAPSQTTVENGLSVQQSALRTASDEYCAKAREAGWVSDGDGLMGLARILMHGQSDEEQVSEDYAAQVGAETEASPTVYSIVAEDARQAAIGLTAVTREARAVLTGDADANRADVMSFERTLVNAQSAQRAFARALDLASRRSEVSPVDADQAVALFAAQIDDASAVADKLAARYSAVDRAVS